MSDLLKQGYEKKNSERLGVTGIVRTAIENMADVNKGNITLVEAAVGMKNVVVNSVTSTLKSAARAINKLKFWGK